MQRFIISKWTKTAALLSHDMLKPYIPQTVPMTQESLKAMLDEHHMVYIKPDCGTFGNGVIRVEHNLISGESHFSFQIGETIKRFTQYDAMYESILMQTKKKSYLVQKGIHLLQYQKRRFDIRVMIQQNLKKKWEASGLIGRVAHPNKIVTNYHSGGTPKETEVH
jgi:glutathione synthase/RimK-type ligase-like ATP-grasp enzyme